MSSSRGGAVPDPGQIDDDGDVLVALAGVPPYAAIDTKHPDTVEPGEVGDQDPPALGQDGVVGGVPGDSSATRATVRCWQTIADSAQRSPPRVSLARGSAALLVSCRHT